MKLKKSNFTLLELIISMGIFVILLFIISIIFTSAQRVWTQSAAKMEVFENARVAMDMMTRDLQSITSRFNGYETPFWYKPQSGTDAYSNELINFVASVPEYSEPCEIKYQLYYRNNLSDNYVGFLNRSITNNRPDPKWNFTDNFTAGLSGSDNAFTANNDSNFWPQGGGLIQHVTELTFICYDETGAPIDGIVSTNDPDDLIIPFSVEISLTLLDKHSWNKWVEMAGTVTGESTAALAFRQKNERTFTKTVLIGNRGQYNN